MRETQSIKAMVLVRLFFIARPSFHSTERTNCHNSQKIKIFPCSACNVDSIRVFDKTFSLDQIGSGQAMGEPLHFYLLQPCLK